MNLGIDVCLLDQYLHLDCVYGQVPNGLGKLK